MFAYAHAAIASGAAGSDPITVVPAGTLLAERMYLALARVDRGAIFDTLARNTVFTAPP